MNRFRQRIVELFRDKDAEVAAAAVRLLRLTLLSNPAIGAGAGGGGGGEKLREELLAAEELLLSPDEGVRAEVGRLLAQQLEAFSGAPQEDGAADAEDEAAAPAARGKAAAAAAGKQAAAKAAAAVAAGARRARSQLETLVQLGLRLLPHAPAPAAAAAGGGDGEEEDDEAADGEGALAGVPAHGGSEAMAFVASAFWPCARAGVLVNWEAYRAFLLGKAPAAAAAAAADDADDGAGAAGAGAGASAASGDLPEASARMAIRLLHACVWRSAGEGFALDGRVGVPAGAGGAGEGAGAGAGAEGDGGDGGGDGGYLTSASDLGAVAAFRERMSGGVCALLPDLLARFGDSPEACALLCSALQALSLSAFAQARHSKALQAALHQLQRMLALHTSPLPLAAAAAALRHLAVEPHAHNRAAAAALQKVMARVAADATRVATRLARAAGGAGDEDAAAAAAAAAGAKHKAKGGRAAAATAAKGKAKARGGRRGADMDDEEEEEGEEGAEDEDEGEDGDGRGGAGGAAGYAGGPAAAGLAVLLRRLRVLAAAAADVDPLPLPELDDAGSALLAAVGAVLGARADCAALFAGARAGGEDGEGEGGEGEGGAEVASAAGAGAALERCCPALTREALQLLAGAAGQAALRAAQACKRLPDGASADECAEVAAQAQRAAALRDAAVERCVAYLALRHPGAAAAAGGASQHIPPSAPRHERAFVLRARFAAFSALCALGRACGALKLAESAPLRALGWQPSEEHSRVLSAFANAAMNLSARDFALMGVAVKMVHVRDAAEAGADEEAGGGGGGGAGEDDGDEDALEMVEEDTQMSSAGFGAGAGAGFGAGGAGGAGSAAAAALSGLTAKQATEAKLAARAGALETRNASLQMAKVLLVLRPLAELSMAAPEAVRLGHTVGRRVLEDDTEVGSFGLALVKLHQSRLRAVAPKALMQTILRSALDGAQGLMKLRARLLAVRAEHDAAAEADLTAQLNLVCGEVIKLVRRQSLSATGHAARNTGKAPKELELLVINMLASSAGGGRARERERERERE